LIGSAHFEVLRKCDGDACHIEAMPVGVIVVCVDRRQPVCEFGFLNRRGNLFLGDDNIAYLPKAFDEASRAELERRYPDAVHVNEEDASVLGLNSFGDGRTMLIAGRATDFDRQLTERGYETIGLDLSELLLGGGGIKCCTLELRR
jgi:hypothetical protein